MVTFTRAPGSGSSAARSRLTQGSDYGTGVLNGVLVTLEPQKVKAYQFVRG